MAISLNTTGSISGANVNRITDNTVSPSSGSNVALFVSVGIHDSNATNRVVATAVWSSTLTHLASSDAGGGVSTRSEIWYLNAPGTGIAYGMEVDTSGTVSFLSMGSLFVNGANQSAPDASITAQGTNNSATATLSTSTSNIWTFTSLLCEPVITFPGGNWTTFENKTGQSFQHAGADYDTSGDKTATYSLSYGAAWQLCMASIAPYVAPSSIPNKIVKVNYAVQRGGSI
jgi:hypothetical protein